MPWAKKKKSFTLIELLIVIAILGILAAAVLVAINPGKRTKQARDAQRKTHVTSIANALVGYYTLNGQYPYEAEMGSFGPACDTSQGISMGSFLCAPSGTDWNTDAGHIYDSLVTTQGFLKQLPKDPLNGTYQYYRYEPSDIDYDGSGPTFPADRECTAPIRCDYYWIGAYLEAPYDPDRPVFRCTDINLPEGPGCKMVPGALVNHQLN